MNEHALINDIYLKKKENRTEISMKRKNQYARETKL